jgi:beta-1,4-mannosyl-glycoprotein beta-1,4-N-acetylglucosaminyltransferase
MSKVVDAFPFFNELNLLQIRLETLGPFVDYFLIVEARETFAGQKKPSFFLENQEMFDKFRDKIVHLQIDSFPTGLSPFEREWFQRNAMLPKLLELAEDDDLVIFGDVDEIPSPAALEYSAQHNFEQKPIIHCAQDLFYYYFNLEEVSGTLLSYSGEYPFIFKKKWLGSVICKLEYLRKFELATFRSPQQKNYGYRFRKGGWHFSFVGEAEDLGVENRIITKIRSYAHQEYNNEIVFDSVLTNVNAKRDLFGRNRSRFRKLKSLEQLPEYLRDNPELFSGNMLS